MGFEFKNSTDDLIEVNDMKFKLIRRIEFSSDRKRMSVLLKDLTDGKFKLYIKGADNVIMERGYDKD